MQSQRRQATLRWCCRVAAALAVGFAGLFLSTLVWRFRVNPTPRLTIRAYDGLIGFMVVDSSLPMPVGIYREREQRPHLKLEAKTLSGPGAWGGVASMVFPTAAMTLLWAPLWWRERVMRRRALVGHCARCGYDLRGLGVAKCPECGGAQPPIASTG
jgi:hypothetical protein